MSSVAEVQFAESASPSKRRIIEVALDRFAAHGFRGTSVKEIMLEAGLTQGSLYNHFSSKEDLLFSILEELGVEFTRALDAAHDEADPDDPADQLFRLVEAIALFALRNPKPTKIANVDYVELGPENVEKEIAYRLENRRRIERIIQAGIDKGVFSVPRFDGANDVKLTATAMANVAIRLSEVQGPHPTSKQEELARFHAELALRMVTGHQS